MLPGALCANNFSRTHSSPCVRVGVRKAKCNGDTRCTASGARKGRAKHGVEWLRLQLLASRGAYCPLPLCIPANAHHGTLVCRHMLAEARGPAGSVGGVNLHIDHSILFCSSPQTHRTPADCSVSYEDNNLWKSHEKGRETDQEDPEALWK